MSEHEQDQQPHEQPQEQELEHAQRLVASLQEVRAPSASSRDPLVRTAYQIAQECGEDLAALLQRSRQGDRVAHARHLEIYQLAQERLAEASRATKTASMDAVSPGKSAAEEAEAAETTVRP